MIFKWAIPASFCLFSFFSDNLQTKNWRLQLDSNLDRQKWRRARWPLDHHHGPRLLLCCNLKIFKIRLNLLFQTCGHDHLGNSQRRQWGGQRWQHFAKNYLQTSNLKVHYFIFPQQCRQRKKRKITGNDLLKIEPIRFWAASFLSNFLAFQHFLSNS